METVMKHLWEFVVAAGGWEAYQCRRCGKAAYPNIFGYFWADWLPWLRCKGPQDPDEFMLDG